MVVFTELDLLLLVCALMIMGVGLLRRKAMWQRGQREDRSGNWCGFIRYLLGHGKILERRSSGIAHLILFYGVFVPTVVIILAQFPLTMPLVLSRWISVFLDILGLAVLVGTLFFLVRRFRSSGPGRPQKAILPVVVLLCIILSGFLAEGTRLSITHPSCSWESPVGWLFSVFLPPSPLLMQLIIRFHFFAVLLFIALIPFSFMRHLVAASLNVWYSRGDDVGHLNPVGPQEGRFGAKSIEDFSWKQLLDAEACVSCGRCDENCPAFISGKPLSPRKVVRDILEQMEMIRGNDVGALPLLEDAVTGDELWSCTMCMACVANCPVFVDPLQKILEMRKYRVMGKATIPTEAGSLIRNLELYSDVQGKGIAHREEWAFNRGVPVASKYHQNLEVLLWVGCSGAFHPRYQEATRAMVKILKAGGIRFAVLGKEELCCGDPARRIGEEALFRDLVRRNIRELQRYQFNEIVALCPHCFNTLRNEYPVFGSTFRVVHASEFLDNIIAQKKITLKYPVPRKTAIHDPCYLGRVNGIYEPLRKIMRAVPGIDLKELGRTRKKGFCCGGGGGRMWLHEELGTRINQVRAEEIVHSEVELLTTACPYCLTMLEDGLQSIEAQKPSKVMDIVEVIAASLG